MIDWWALIAAFVIPYRRVHWWDFAPSTIAIIYLATRIAPWRALAVLGLKTQNKLRFCALATVLTFVLRPVIVSLAAHKGLRFDVSAWNLGWRSRPLFQVLNEEMVLRALLLGVLLKKCKTRWTRLSASSGVALVFSLLHLALYWLKDGIILSDWTLLNLFLFGAWANAMWLATSHIGWGFAVHLAWNLTRFGGDFLAGGHVVPEAQTFNLIEGSATLTPILATLAVAGHLAALRRAQRS